MPINARILFNDNNMSRATQRGAARYVNHILGAVISRYGDRVTVCTNESKVLGSAKYIRPPQIGHKFLDAKIHDFVAGMSAIFGRATLFYSSVYGSSISAGLKIYSVYDMIYELFPDYFPQSRPGVRHAVHDKRKCLEEAALLLAISHNTADDITRIYPQIDKNKIVVTPLGVDAFFFEREDIIHQDKPYFLFVGNRGLYKNFLRFLQAYGQSGLADDFDIQVVSPASGKFSEPEEQIIQKFNLAGKVKLLLSADEQSLRAAYAGAHAFIYPSEYEGFGLPILEAFASGTIVATSGVSSMPEVGNNAALYFVPQDIDSIAQTLCRLASMSDAERESRLSAGLAQAKLYTWERCQTLTIDAFEKLMT